MCSAGLSCWQLKLYCVMGWFMQKQDCYKVIQALVAHLDNKAKEACVLKQGILDALSQCVIVAADGSLGE